MYLFYVTHNYCPDGSDGAMEVTNVKSMLKLRELASSFLGKRYGRVYCMTRWTQEMCQLTSDCFTAYIMTHGQLVAKNEDE